MRICELKQREVINVKDCKRLGFVGDVDFDISTGKMLAIIVPGPGCVWGFLGREKEYIIPFCDIPWSKSYTWTLGPNRQPLPISIRS